MSVAHCRQRVKAWQDLSIDCFAAFETFTLTEDPIRPNLSSH